MKICGIELKGSDAIICIMSRENGLYDIPHVRVQKISIADAGDSEQIRGFQFAFAKLMEDYKVDKVIIRGRALKGKFAGGPVGFKLEATIQLIQDLPVEFISGSAVKKLLAKSQVDIDFRDTGLKQYQENAFETVFSYFEQTAYNPTSI